MCGVRKDVGGEGWWGEVEGTGGGGKNLLKKVLSPAPGPPPPFSKTFQLGVDDNKRGWRERGWEKNFTR
nr:hypothetical protein RVX_2515 [Nitratidesulfovibrio sp. HK-II]